MIKALTSAGFLLSLCPCIVSAQNDSSFVAEARRNAIGIYTQSVGVQSHLFNGSEYKEYISQRDEFPALYEETVTGNIMYGGHLYEGIQLYYDLETDQVVTQYTYGNKVQLLRNKVEFFEMGGHRFVRLDTEKMTEGFYDLLYDGDLKFYARRTKERTIKINGTDADNYFQERVKYFILKKGIYHTVRSKRSVLALVSDKKKDLNKALREEKIKFGKDREKAIAFILARYEQRQ